MVNMNFVGITLKKNQIFFSYFYLPWNKSYGHLKWVLYVFRDVYGYIQRLHALYRSVHLLRYTVTCTAVVIAVEGDFLFFTVVGSQDRKFVVERIKRGQGSGFEDCLRCFLLLKIVSGV
jgi:hypothetical protein